MSADKVTRSTGSINIPQVGSPKTHKVTKSTTKSVAVTQAFDCKHPVLNDAGVKSLIFFFGIEGPVPGPFIGSKTWTLKAIEQLLPIAGVDATNTIAKSVAKDSALEDSVRQTLGQNTANTDP